MRKKMTLTEEDFKKHISGAQTFMILSGADFWRGYHRGLRRLYHGGDFGTDAEHELWMTLADATGDDQRRDRGRGYRLGYAGVSISEALRRSDEGEK